MESDSPTLIGRTRVLPGAIKGLLASLALTLLLMGIAGCDQKAMLRRFTPPAENKMAREFIDDIRRGDIIEAEMLLAPEVRRGNAESGLRELAGLFKAGELKSIEVIGANSSTFVSAGKTRKTVNLSYQIELSTGWLIGSVVIVDDGSGRSITSARFNRSPDSLDVLNRFTFEGKKVIHYLFLALAIVIPIFSIAVVVVCARSRIKRKWLWIVFILLGFITFRLNWTTGQMDYALINFQLLGAGVFKAGPYAPWIIGVSLPIGAIVFLFKRKRLAVPVSPPIQTG
jgi:hypothetical protein